MNEVSVFSPPFPTGIYWVASLGHANRTFVEGIVMADAGQTVAVLLTRDMPSVIGVDVLQSTTESLHMTDADYPLWLIRLFPVAIVALGIGLFSLLYIAVVGFSPVALVGSYFIPLALTSLYYLLGVAERSNSG